MNYGTDWGLRARILATFAGLGFLYAAFVVAMAKWMGNLPVVAVGAVALIGLQYYYSDRIALKAAGATRVGEEAYPDVQDRLTRLARQAQVPAPDLAVIDSGTPNAFATGRSPEHATVCVTRGLVETLDDRELDAVLAHELAHVKHRDVAVLTLVSGLSTAAYFFVRNFWWFGDGDGGGDGGGGDSGQPWFLIAVGVSVVVWIGSYLLIRAVSRYREYAADRGAASITGDPAALASALATIEDDVAEAPDEDLRSGFGMNALYVIPTGYDVDALELLETHPSTEKRIERLRELERGAETGD